MAANSPAREPGDTWLLTVRYLPVERGQHGGSVQLVKPRPVWVVLGAELLGCVHSALCLHSASAGWDPGLKWKWYRGVSAVPELS